MSDLFSATGFHQAATVTPDTVVKSVRFVATGHYGSTVDGKAHDSYHDALVVAIAHGRAARAQDGSPVNPLITVDVRWELADSTGRTIRDLVAERFMYETPDKGAEHLALIRKYGLPAEIGYRSYTITFEPNAEGYLISREDSGVIDGAFQTIAAAKVTIDEWVDAR